MEWLLFLLKEIISIENSPLVSVIVQSFLFFIMFICSKIVSYSPQTVISVIFFCRIGCGTSWHSAGLVGQIRSQKVHTDICTYSRNLYKSFEDQGYSVGWYKFSLHLCECLFCPSALELTSMCINMWLYYSCYLLIVFFLRSCGE